MKKIEEILRLALRKTLVALGVTTMPILVHAGYGNLQQLIEPDPPLTVPVQGKIVSEETGEPVAGIRVWYDKFNAYTDSDGSFFFYLPEEDTYNITFSDIDGFENGGYFSEKQISITRDEIGNSLEVNLYKGSAAVICGTVLSRETGEPVSGIEVSIGFGNYAPSREFRSFRFAVLSDDSGQFSITVPEQNTYIISFSDINGLFQLKTMNLTSDEIKSLLTVDLEKKAGE